MRFYNSFFIFLFFILFHNNSVSQQGLPIYTDYLTENYYLLHPSMAGVNLEGIKIRMTSRKSWLDQAEAPNLQTFSIDSRLSNRSGAGLIFFKDQNGYNSNSGLTLTYAHHINYNSRDSRMAKPDILNFGNINQLSFGLSIGGVQNTHDQSSFLNPYDPDSDLDPLVTGLNESSGYFNMDVGVSYVNLNYFAHLTVKNLLFYPSKIYGDEIYPFSDDYFGFMKYVASVGYLIFTEGPLSFEPSVLFHGYQLTGEKSMDYNLKTYYDLNYGYLWFGFSYRNSFDGAQYQIEDNIKKQNYSLLTPIFGISYKDFIFSYNYSYQSGKIAFGKGGFHQLTLGYNVSLFN